MKNFTLFILFFIQPVFAVTQLKPKALESVTQSKMEQILTNIFYDELYRITKDLEPEKQTIQPRESINSGKRGKMIIEQLKQKNREKLARLRGFDPDKVKSGKDLIKFQQEDNKLILEKIKLKEASGEWERKARSEIQELKRKVLVEHKEWRKNHLSTLKKWDLKKKVYRDELDIYKQSISDIPLILPVSEEEKIKRVEVKVTKEAFFVSASLTLGMRDQRSRPTCSSFSGIRGIEILLAQNNKKQNLSEQYFYWASKPKCQNRKCSEKGSWVGDGLLYSKNQPSPDIPVEAKCQYNNTQVSSNDTQIPLAQTCNEGVVKVNSYSYLKNLDGVMNSLHKNKAVIASIELSPNFYKNQGLVLYRDINQKGMTDSHAKGHSVLIIGYMKLPKVLNEGSVCFVTTNSWGIGWGHGGHACLSEKWLMSYRKSNPFVAINSIGYSSK